MILFIDAKSLIENKGIINIEFNFNILTWLKDRLKLIKPSNIYLIDNKDENENINTNEIWYESRLNYIKNSLQDWLGIKIDVRYYPNDTNRLNLIEDIISEDKEKQDIILVLKDAIYKNESSIWDSILRKYHTNSQVVKIN